MVDNLDIDPKVPVLTGESLLDFKTYRRAVQATWLSLSEEEQKRPGPKLHRNLPLARGGAAARCCDTPLRRADRRRVGRITLPGCAPGNDHGTCCRSPRLRLQLLAGASQTFQWQSLGRRLQPIWSNAEIGAREADKHAEQVGISAWEARTGQRGLSDEPRRCSGQLPTARAHNFGGAAFASRAGVAPTTCHLPVAATIRVHSEAALFLGAQTCQNPVVRSKIRPPRCDQRRLPGIGHPRRLVMMERAVSSSTRKPCPLRGTPHDRPTLYRRRRDHEGLHNAHGRDRRKGGNES